MVHLIAAGYVMSSHIGIPHAKLIPGSDFVRFRDEEIAQSIARRFEHQAMACGDRLAIQGDEERYTFTALNQTANRLARVILSHRPVGEEAIALLFDHGGAVLVAMLAVLKTGKFYVALDASYPTQRIEYMIEDCGAKLIVADRNNLAYARRLAGADVEVVCFDEVEQWHDDSDLNIESKPESLAFLLYTSGSTGRPKGVMHTHENVLVDVRNLTNGWYVTKHDRWLLYTSVSFANSVRTIYSSLLNGAAIYPYDIKKNGFDRLTDWLIANKITIVRGVPTWFRDFAATLDKEQKFPDVRILSVGGEPMLRSDVEYFNRHFLSHCVLVHALGPTECLTVCWAMIPHGTRITGAKLPIGFSLPDKDVQVLDEMHREVANGEVGELAVKSRYISPGYWRDPEKTKAMFLSDPQGSDARIYLTGDLGFRNEDGSLVHIGRRDFQVKIRGFRIDISEVETALRSIHGVGDSVVSARQDDPEEERLVAYLVPTTQPPPTHTALRRALAELLPDYMIPSTFVYLDTIPQTPNGKTDRLRLPPPSRQRPILETPFVAPESSVESNLSAIWCNVLGLDEIGVHDNFLELGGDSLRATRIVSRVAPVVGGRFSIKDLFEAPTVRQVANLLISRLAEE